MRGVAWQLGLGIGLVVLGAVVAIQLALGASLPVVRSVIAAALLASGSTLVAHGWTALRHGDGVDDEL